jgi:predicted MPP superfamily phosphohydrolase
MEKPKNRLKRRLLITLLVLAVLVGLAALWAFLIEPELLTVTNLTISDVRLPEGMDGIRVVYFADLHLGPFYSEDDAARVAKKIQSLHPDLVLFGGDFIDGYPTARNMDTGRVSRAFAQIDARFGKFAIFGNHDAGTPEAKKLASGILTDGGFTVLEGAAVKIADGFYVAGTAPYPSNAESLAWTAANGSFSLLLAHEPAQIEKNSKFAFALQLSGHTHGGQVALPLIGPIFLPYATDQYKSGLYHVNGVPLYVTRGVGTTIARVRFLAPPEIVVITLRRQ